MHSVSNPSRVRLSGPLAVCAAGFAAELRALGYSPASATTQLQLVAHLSRWLDARELTVGELTVPVIEAFLVDRRRDHTHLYAMGGLEPVLRYLRREWAAPAADDRSATFTRDAGEVVLTAFRRYLLVERLVSAPVADAYVRCVRPFVEDVAATDPELTFTGVGAAQVTRFLTGYLPRLPRKTAQMTATALRSFLRFLYAAGRVEIDFAPAVPPFAFWKLSGLPQPLTPAQVHALVAACDPSVPVGRRDRAVIACLVRLGLRCGEVAALRLEDLNWTSGTVTVHGKGNRIDVLPLPVDVGQVIVGYLRQGRPAPRNGPCSSQPGHHSRRWRRAA